MKPGCEALMRRFYVLEVGLGRTIGYVSVFFKSATVGLLFWEAVAILIAALILGSIWAV